jgi:hypothetical protein
MNRLPSVLKNEIWEYVRGDRTFWKLCMNHVVAELRIHQLCWMTSQCMTIKTREPNRERYVRTIFHSIKDRRGGRRWSFVNRIKRVGDRIQMIEDFAAKRPIDHWIVDQWLRVEALVVEYGVYLHRRNSRLVEIGPGSWRLVTESATNPYRPVYDWPSMERFSWKARKRPDN